MEVVMKKLSPIRSELLEVIEQKIYLKDCMRYYGTAHKVFMRWLKESKINHNFTVNRNNNAGILNTKEAVKKRAETRHKKFSIDFSCLNCGRVFNKPKCKKKRFCCIECAYEYRSKEKSEKISTVCKWCGKVFERFPCLIKKEGNFCSTECHYRYRDGKSFDELYGETRARKIKSKIAKKTEYNNKYNPVYFTKPHQILKRAMIENGLYIGFSTSEYVDFWEIDELNREKKIVVEVDGDYWHNLIKVKVRDVRKNIYLEKLGYTVVRFWEKDILTDLAGCINKLREVLNDKN
jgi:very-short-patch-repair endonuclease